MPMIALKIHTNRRAGHLALEMAIQIYVDIVNYILFCSESKEETAIC